MSQCVFDIEANALDARDVTTIWCIVIQDIDTEEIFKYGPDKISEAVEKLSTYSRIVGHNIYGYDIPVLVRLCQFKAPSLSIDTLVLSRLANPDRMMPWGMKGRKAPHSVLAWGKRLGGEEKVEHEDWSQYSENMMKRCETDVKINLEIYKALWNEFKE